MTQLQSRYKEKNVKKKKDNCDDVCLNARKRAPHIFMVSFSFFFFVVVYSSFRSSGDSATLKVKIKEYEAAIESYFYVALNSAFAERLPLRESFSSDTCSLLRLYF